MFRTNSLISKISLYSAYSQGHPFPPSKACAPYNILDIEDLPEFWSFSRISLLSLKGLYKLGSWQSSCLISSTFLSFLELFYAKCEFVMLLLTLLCIFVRTESEKQRFTCITNQSFERVGLNWRWSNLADYLRYPGNNLHFHSAYFVRDRRIKKINPRKYLVISRISRPWRLTVYPHIFTCPSFCTAQSDRQIDGRVEKRTGESG